MNARRATAQAVTTCSSSSSFSSLRPAPLARPAAPVPAHRPRRGVGTVRPGRGRGFRPGHVRGDVHRRRVQRPTRHGGGRRHPERGAPPGRVRRDVPPPDMRQQTRAGVLPRNKRLMSPVRGGQAKRRFPEVRGPAPRGGERRGVTRPRRDLQAGLILCGIAAVILLSPVWLVLIVIIEKTHHG